MNRLLLTLTLGIASCSLGCQSSTEHDATTETAIESLAYMYGVAAMEHHYAPEKGCDMLRDADRIAAKIPNVFDRNYLDTMAGMGELRKDCQ